MAVMPQNCPKIQHSLLTSVSMSEDNRDGRLQRMPRKSNTTSGEQRVSLGFARQLSVWGLFSINTKGGLIGSIK